MYEIVQSSTISYFITSGTRDITYAGNTYTAYPAARTDFTISGSTAEIALTLAVPLSHPLVQRWCANASPPQKVSVIVRRLQVSTGDVEQIYAGVLDSLQFDKHVAKFTIVSNATRQWARPAGVLVSSFCSRFLYDAGCTISRAAFSVSTTLTFVDGRKVIVASLAPLLPTPGDVAFFAGGDLYHPASGERQTIIAHTGTTLTLQSEIPGILAGDVVVVAAGCAHDIFTCDAKFGNQINFFGQPQLPVQDLFILGNDLGVLSRQA